MKPKSRQHYAYIGIVTDRFVFEDVVVVMRGTSPARILAVEKERWLIHGDVGHSVTSKKVMFRNKAEVEESKKQE